MIPTTTDPARRCRVVKLDATDLARAVDDPGLAALVTDGWTVLASAHVTDETEAGERSSLALLLAPPRPHREPSIPGLNIALYILTAATVIAIVLLSLHLVVVL